MIRKDERSDVKCTWDFIKQRVKDADKSTWDKNVVLEVERILAKQEPTKEDKALVYSSILIVK